MPAKTSHRAYLHPVERMALSYRSWPCQRKYRTARKCSASDAWRPPTGAGHASEKHHTARKCTLSSAWRSPTGAGHASENTAPRVNTAHRTHGVLLQELAMPTKTSHRA